MDASTETSKVDRLAELIAGNAVATASERYHWAFRAYDRSQGGSAEADAAEAAQDKLIAALEAAEKADKRTIVYPTVMHKKQAEAAVSIVSADRTETSTIRHILRLQNGEVIVKTLDLGAGTWIIETENGPFAGKSDFTVIFESRSTSTYHGSQDEALLRAIELRNGGSANEQGYLFAARALGVPTQD